VDFWTCSVMCLIESLPPCNDRSTHAPRAPLRANAVRNSFPRPLAAPVTTHVLPSREKVGSIIGVRESTGDCLAANLLKPRDIAGDRMTLMMGII